MENSEEEGGVKVNERHQMVTGLDVEDGAADDSWNESDDRDRKISHVVLVKACLTGRSAYDLAALPRLPLTINQISERFKAASSAEIQGK